MTSPGAWLAALWIVWAVIWLATAAKTNKTVSRQPRSARLAHGLPSALGAYLLASPKPFGLPPITLIARAPLFLWACAAVTAAGIAHTFWARAHLGRLWSGIVTLKEDHKIVRSGPYGITRHPIYTGLLLALAATGLARGTAAAFLGVGIIAAGFTLKMRQEEEMLLGRFGEAYRAYQREVPRLFPKF